MHGRDSRAKAGKINELERDRARHSTQTAKMHEVLGSLHCALCIYCKHSRSPHNAPHSPSSYLLLKHFSGSLRMPMEN